MDFPNSQNSESHEPHQQFQNASFANIGRSTETSPHRADDPQFDIFEWYPKYQSCQRYFLDHSQHSGPVQAVCAFVNIHLPFQRYTNPVLSYNTPRLVPGMLPNPPIHQQPQAFVSCVPYLRRLVATGLDFPGVLHGFFGDDWAAGVGPLHEQERRNYLFAAKSGGWAAVKKDYDMSPLDTVPFLRPLQGPVISEIEAAEKSWSEWLAMEDWMVGPRAPDTMEQGQGRGQQAQGQQTRVQEGHVQQSHVQQAHLHREQGHPGPGHQS